MSYSSELTKKRILRCAEKEFLKTGFLGTNLQDIVKAAKVTTGAVYRHFKDKENLFFSLVATVYNQTLEIMQHEEEYDPADFGQDAIEVSYRQTMEFVEYIYAHKKEFQLLLKCSVGSRVEHFIDEVTVVYARQSKSFIDTAYREGFAKKLPTDLDIYIITKNFISAICECILQDVPYEQVGDYIRVVVTFQHFGLYGVLGLLEE